MTARSAPSDWLVAQYKPNSHRIAQRHLNRQKFETFLPLLASTRRARNRFETRLTPLFPGYIFIAAGDPSAPWPTINSTQGISRLVSFGAAPATVPAALIEALQARCDPDGAIAPGQTYQQGDAVEMTAGPFTQFAAEVEAMTADQRVTVLFSFLGQTTRMTVDAAQLSRAPS